MADSVVVNREVLDTRKKKLGLTDEEIAQKAGFSTRTVERARSLQEAVEQWAPGLDRWMRV